MQKRRHGTFSTGVRCCCRAIFIRTSLWCLSASRYALVSDRYAGEKSHRYKRMVRFHQSTQHFCLELGAGLGCNMRVIPQMEIISLCSQQFFFAQKQTQNPGENIPHNLHSHPQPSIKKIETSNQQLKFLLALT